MGNLKIYIINDIINWKSELESKSFNKNDLLFPQINSVFNINGNPIYMLSKNNIKISNTMRGIFKKAFKLNNPEYINPHSFRHTRSIAEYCKTTILYAFNENIGHTLNPDVLLNSYGRGTEKENILALKSVNLEIQNTNQD